MSLPALRPKGEFNRLRYPADKPPYRHEGEDWLFKIGTRQGAPIAGTLRFANEPGGFGLVAKITVTRPDGSKVRALCGHFSSGIIKPGTTKKVKAGQYIGKSGKSGNASGLPVAEHHTHLQIEVDGVPVKPSRGHLLNLAHPW